MIRDCVAKAENVHGLIIWVWAGMTRPSNIKFQRAETNGLRENVRSIFVNEAAAIELFAAHGLDLVCDAVDLIASRKGSIVVSGVGKSGHISRKIASTFRSLGRHAVFMHAAEGSHGDLGLIDHDGLVLALSNSGETEELADLLAYCRSQRIPIIAITAKANSTLGTASDICIAYGNVDEACINGLAPTTSTTLALAIGDALAVGYSYVAGVTAEDFRRFHPGGKLGARLRKVREVMRTGRDLPIVAPDANFSEVTFKIAEKSLGCALVVEGDRTLGIITDGDIRRHAAELPHLKAIDVASPNPVAVDPDSYLEMAAAQLSEAKVSVGIIQDLHGHTIGLLHIHQCVTN